ncbi:outer membrane beta-barrel protein [Sphingomonas sp. R647]|uniref:outer membrane beta-barrel protein n=1 Tax=Sphingomonas sp. R647 TaxID=2875233 RepID=UPI001CD1D0E2|nr:outer membrane beta-barrel protein [Sphingomonas sp. R647]MCA1196351.1 outer membrane beta-barrel protein [Sphingomonas sp. R647]
MNAAIDPWMQVGLTKTDMQREPGAGAARRSGARVRHAIVLLAAIAGAKIGTAGAQTTDLLIDPPPPTDYDRGRNVSVQQRARPEYDPLGVRIGAFIASPSITTGIGASDNVYTDNNNKRADVYLSVQPYLAVASNWNVHSTRITAAGDIKRYANETLKNQNAWYVYSQTRFDIVRDASLLIDAQIDRAFESPYNDDIAANSLTPSTFLRTQIGAKGTYAQTRTRLIATLDRNTYRFSAIRFADGTVRDQGARDRSITRAGLTYEYGVSPDLSFYAQATGDLIDYWSPTFFGRPNRDSKGGSLVLGSNFDIAGVARGTIGVGYTYRDYNATGTYRDAQGVSVQARAEWFATPLTTLNVSLQRRLMDVSLGNSGAYWDTRVGLRADHELLYNLILSAGIEAIRRDYSELDTRTDAKFAQISGRYRANREFGLNFQIGYGTSKPSGSRLSDPFDEFRLLVGVQLRR